MPDFSVVRPKAETGDPEAQVILASAYRDGLGLTNDNKAALHWFQKAVAQKYAPAQYGLGMMLNHGHGVEKNVNEAMQWFTRAARQGYAPAQSALAAKFLAGKDVKRDLVEAYKWFTLASGATNRTIVNLRDSVAEKMSKRDIAEAERRVVEFKKMSKRRAVVAKP